MGFVRNFERRAKCKRQAAGVINGVVEEISPLGQTLVMSINQLPSHPIPGEGYTTAELEKIALNNLQALIYKADVELIKSWLPIICSAIKTGELGETVIMGYAQYATGDHEALKITLRNLEAEFSDEFRRELIELEKSLLRMRYEFTFGNFEKVEEIYSALPTIKEYPFNRANDMHFSKHRASLVSAFYLQDKENFDLHYGAIEKFLTGKFGSIEHLNVNSFKAMRAFMVGSYIEANEYALAAIKSAGDAGANGAYLPFEAAYILADTYLEFGEINKSIEVTDKFLALAIEFNQYPWITAFYAKASIIKLQEGNISGALAMLRKGREVVSGPLFNATLSYPLDVHELMIRLPMGDMERIIEILYRLPDVELTKTFKGMLEFLKNPALGPSILSSFPDTTDQDKFRREGFMAILNIQNRPEAIKHLRNAIELAIPNGYFRSFLNMPPEIRSYLLDIASETPTIYLEKLSVAIRAQGSGSSDGKVDGFAPLTKRELDVLRRLGTNEPITKIAASLHISNNTIKTHLKNLYRKLCVESRDEAVARGKELSLL
jgi:DNA-binding NarL/FixJ family response regulator